MLQPRIIQGGMGVAVSGWKLARAVSLLGQLGVVSGTALDVVLARRLQLGDPGGELRRALASFPIPEMAARVLGEFFIEGGKASGTAFKNPGMPMLVTRPQSVELMVVANFVEVFLAKEGHGGLVGINYLEKVQLPTLPSLYGAMLAGVDFVLMGAGIPRAIPGILDQLAQGLPAKLRIDVECGSPGEEHVTQFDPAQFCAGGSVELKRPQFLCIVASATLAMTMAKKASGRVDGFVVEGPTAGGHNAPPRGVMQLSATGEPIYGARDVPELEKIKELGLPYWMAGSCGKPEKLAECLAAGAAGVQVGTAFAFCSESGIDPELKAKVIHLSQLGQSHVFTDPKASPTGFPFKLAEVGGTLSEKTAYDARLRICDLGHLRHLYRKGDGSIGYRCPAEPVSDFIAKGGTLEQTEGRKCICNGLPAAVGLGQVRSRSGAELALVTCGDDLAHLREFIPPGKDSYSAADVIRRILGGTV